MTQRLYHSGRYVTLPEDHGHWMRLTSGGVECKCGAFTSDETEPRAHWNQFIDHLYSAVTRPEEETP